MAGRSESKATEAIKKFHADNASVNTGSVVWLPLDLADPSSVIKAAKTVSTSESRLDIISKFGFIFYRNTYALLIISSK
jgi:hypothetical protein